MLIYFNIYKLKFSKTQHFFQKFVKQIFQQKKRKKKIKEEKKKEIKKKKKK